MEHRAMKAAAAYRDIDLSSRVAGASPHGLVAVLMEEAITGMGAIEAACRRGQPSHSTHARVMGILHALEASLDYASGGETAWLMARVYREARRCLSRAAEEIDPIWCKQARETLAPVAEAWAQIAQAA
jgi:flagellar secretion chaperone FliS